MVYINAILEHCNIFLIPTDDFLQMLWDRKCAHLLYSIFSHSVGLQWFVYNCISSNLTILPYFVGHLNAFCRAAYAMSMTNKHLSKIVQAYTHTCTYVLEQYHILPITDPLIMIVIATTDAIGRHAQMYMCHVLILTQ